MESATEDGQTTSRSGEMSQDVVAESTSTSKFAVDSSLISSVPALQQADELRNLGLNVYDQTVFEEGVIEQAENAFQKQENGKQRKRTEGVLKVVLDDIKCAKSRLKQIEKALALTTNSKAPLSKEAKRKIDSIKNEKENKLKQLKTLRAKQRTLLGHISNSTSLDVDTDVDSDAEELDAETKCELQMILGLNSVKETEREALIRTGQMTPFGSYVNGKEAQQQSRRITLSSELTDFERYLLDQAELQKTKNKSSPNKIAKNQKALKRNACNGDIKKDSTEAIAMPSTSKGNSLLIPKPKRRRRPKEVLGSFIEGSDEQKSLNRVSHFEPNAEEHIIDLDEFENRKLSSGSEYVPSDQESVEEADEKLRKRLSKPDSAKTKKKKRLDSCNDTESSSSLKKTRLVDDGNQDDYHKRIKKWRKDELLSKYNKIMQSCEDDETDDEESGYEEFEGNYRIPHKIWNKLYRYQQTCVRWLWELHCQQCGGIIGDEMGLGKTIQVIAFLAGLSQSNVVSKDGKYKGLGPVIIVTPTTLMHQWAREFFAWWPSFRVAILHESGSYTGTKESLIRNLNNSRGILITSYSGVVIHLGMLLKYHWHYIILDEGHKIRNPDARVTLACKQFRTVHRMILSGSPLQNHLKELWSLFDFIFPGKLGTLPVFMQQFAVPITHGGYSNATQVQVQTAYKCAVVLRDTISPYLLRRMKADVKMNLSLPNKNEQVLFCRLTDEQRELYKEYLESKDVKSILDGRLQVFVGLINLRKICNHPDLYSGGPKVFGNVDQSTLSEEMHYGYGKRSGKMIVVESVLKIWHRQGHRVLLFSQSKQMLDILERFVVKENYNFLRLDGSTSIGRRQPMIEKFNNDPSVFIFLLTTRVGGLGVNLTGANRVIIYDPDWNPSTDVQARERAWRIGQMRDVTIYRLLTSGTIEEKIYHRQIFKQFLTNRVLKDPKQRRFFKSNDMLELFVLRDDDGCNGGMQTTETSAIFAGTGSEVKITKEKNLDGVAGSSAASCLSVDKLQKMKELAKRLSQKITEKNAIGSTKENQMKTVSSANAAPKFDKVFSVKEDLLKKQTKQNSKKRRKAKKCSTELDGENIDYLVHKDIFKSTGQVDEEIEQNKQSAKHDAYVLQKLFAKSGVHTALKHDTIIESSDPDYLLVEGEAERVAREAVKAMKASRRQCFRAEAGIPSWTGVNGQLPGSSRPRFGQRKNSRLLPEPEKESSVQKPHTVANPIVYNLLKKNKLFDGEIETPATSTAKGEVPCSSHLLATIRHRNTIIPFGNDMDDDHDDENVEDGTSSQSLDVRLTKEYDELLVELRNFIAFECSVDGQATTGEILQKFQDKVPAQDSAVFKALLKRICVFDKDLGGGGGMWVLKGEFR